MKRKEKCKGEMSLPNNSQWVSFGEINVNPSIYQLIQCEKSPPQRLLFFLNRYISVYYYCPSQNQQKETSFTIALFAFCPSLPILAQSYHSQMGRMGKESDSKTKLVLEICSISTRSVLCVHHTLLSKPFIDWYCILGVSSLTFLVEENHTWVTFYDAKFLHIGFS